MTKLSVNLNKVATLRNTRMLGIPSILYAATLCLDAGAHGITVHPRPDQRHIKPDDVLQLAVLLKEYPLAEFNIEGNPFIEYLPVVEKVRPTQCTFVPDAPQAFTSNQGWDLTKNADRLAPVVQKLKDQGTRVSLFMDPIPQQMSIAKQIGADRIELYTEPYAAAFAQSDPHAADAYIAAAQAASAAGLAINAGHDLNLQNLAPLLQKIPSIAEVSIGHALIADALEFGLPQTVKKYLAACGGTA